MSALDQFIAVINGVQDGSIELDEADRTVATLLRENPESAGDFIQSLEAYHAETPLPNIILRHFSKRLEQTRSLHASGAYDATQIAPVLGEDDATVISPPAGINDATVAASSAMSDATVAAEDDATVVSEKTVGLASEGGGDAPVGPGTVLKDRFVLEEPLGEGGMGIVYKAADLLKVEAQDKNPYVAIKVLTAAFKAHPEAFIALQREASKAQRLAHPNIGTVYDFDRENETIFMTMEILEGSELKDYIKTLPAGGLPVDQAMPLIEGMASALGYAHHNGLIHSDFKPGNCFLTTKGVVKVIDFGIARASSTRDNESGETTVFDPGQLGALTPAYATCEMFEGLEPHPADDIYALGCTAYELLTGTHPYNKQSAPKAKERGLKANPLPRNKLTRRQEKALLKSVALDRDQRTQSIEEFIDGILPKKSYGKQIGVAAAALTLLIGALAVKPVQDYLTEQEHKAVIAQLQSNDATLVEQGLAKLSAIPDKRTRDTIALPARQSLLNYYESKISDVLNPEAGRYDYPTAEKLLADATAMFPDSAVVNEYRDSITQSKNDLLNEMTSVFNESLQQGNLIAVDGEDDITDVLDIIRVAAPKNVLLTDKRLNVAYSKEAHKAIDAQNFTKASLLLKTSSQYITDDNNLLNLTDQVQMKVDEYQDEQKAREIATLLETVEPQIETTETLEQISDAVFLLRQIEPRSRSLARIDVKAEKLIAEEISQAATAGQWADAEATLVKFSTILSPAAIDKQRANLTQAEIAAGVQPGSTNLSDYQGQLDALLNSAVYTTEWNRKVIRSFQTLAAAAPGGSKELQPIRQKIAEQYVQQAQSLIEAKRFLGAQQTLTYADSLVPDNSARIAEARKTLVAAEKAFETELAEKARLAELAGLQQTMLTQLQANDLKKGLATFDGLKKNLESDDPFLTETAPKALEEAYLRVAANQANRNEYQAAYNAINSGLERLPDSLPLQTAKQTYEDEAIIAAIREKLGNANSINIAETQRQLSAIQERMPKRYAAIETELQGTLRNRIKSLERSNLRRAHSLLAEAKQLWPNNREITSVRLKELPKPSVYAAKGIEYAEDGYLTKAAGQLREAQTRESGHLDTAQLKDLIADKKRSAESSFNKYQSAAKGDDFESARTHLASAMKTWKDNPDYLQEREKIKTILAKIAAGARPCREKLAGLGRNRRAVCFDIIGTKTRGPALVVVPAGGGSRNAFAITKFELAQHDLSGFCRITRKCNAAARNAQPAVGIAPSVAKQYADWLTRETGYKYSIPTLSEWKHAATAGGREGNSDYNCLLRLNNQVIKGQAMLKVTSGKPNTWGLVNYAGNAQEIITSGGGYKAAGGHYKDQMSECGTSLLRNAPSGGDGLTGIRLKREIK